MQIITQFACALYWFNPLVWIAAGRMVMERERACDDLVLSAGSPACDYADQILQIASGLHARPWAGAAAIAMARPSHLEGRLLAILDDRRSRRALTRTATTVLVAAFMAVVLPVGMMRAAVPGQEAKATKPLADLPAGSQPAEQVGIAPAAIGPAPKLRCDRPRFEFPATWQGDVVEHDFVVSNKGDGPLELLDVKSADGNTQLKYDKVIAPGAAGKVSAALRIRESGGPSRQRGSFSILVTSNDPNQPRLTLALEGRVKPHIGVDPPDMRFGDPSSPEESTRTVKVTNYTDSLMILTPIPPSGQEKTFTVEVKEIEPGKVAEVKVVAKKPPYMPGTTYYTPLCFTTGIDKAKRVCISCKLTIPESATAPAGKRKNAASTQPTRVAQAARASAGHSGSPPTAQSSGSDESSEWLKHWPSDLRHLRDRITLIQREDGTCVYEFPCDDRAPSLGDTYPCEFYWKRLVELKSPGAPLVVHGPPDSVNAAGPAIRFVVRQRAVWPASPSERRGLTPPAPAASEPKTRARETQKSSPGPVWPIADTQPHNSDSATTPLAPAEVPFLPNLKMPPNRVLWVEMDLITDGRRVNLNRLKMPASTPVFDRRIFGPYANSIPAFDPDAVKPPEKPDAAAEVMAKLRQLRVGMARSEVDKILTLQSEHQGGNWTTYYAGTRTEISVAYDQRTGKDRPENEVLDIHAQPTPGPVSAPSPEHREKLARIRKMVRQVVVPGATRAEVERSLILKDGGLQGWSPVRYYLGDPTNARPDADDAVKVDVEYDATGAPDSSSNVVIEPPQVYFDLFAVD